MPAATSPYTQNDYQAVSSLRPYRLPVNDIFKAAVSQDQFWEAGAARVKSYYDNVLNLNLTLEENKQVRDDFMKQAEEQMSKLSTKNLADASVQREGFAIFSPLFKDQAIVQDDYVTKKRQQIISEAERYKADAKTKGQGFHMDNLAYALRPFKEFNSKTSRDQIGNIFEQSKSATYAPYYDVSKERLDILDKCKGNKISGTVNDGPYLKTTSDNSLYQSKLYGCLEGAMSDQARQQIRISGAVRYGDNYAALRNDYLQTAQGKLDHYNEEKSELMAKRAALLKQAGTKEQVDELDGLIGQYNDGIKNAEAKVGEVNGWNEDYIRDNYEDLAYDSYFKRSNESFAAAFSMKEIENSMKSDPWAITEFTQDQINKRQIRDFAHDKEMKNLELRNKLLTGKNADGTDMDPLTAIKMKIQMGGDLGDDFGEFLTSAVQTEGTTASKLISEIGTIDNNHRQTISNVISSALSAPALRDALAPIGISPTNFSGDQYKKFWRTVNAYVDTTLKTNPSDPLASQLRDAHNELVRLGNKKAMLQGIYDGAKDEVIKSQPNIEANFIAKASTIANGVKKPVNLSIGTIGAERVRKILMGEDPEYITGVETRQTSTGAGGALGGGKNQDFGVIKSRSGKIVGYLDQALEVEKLKQSKSMDFEGAMNENLQRNTATQRMGLATGNLFVKGSPALRDMETWFGNTFGVVGKDVNFNAVGGLDIQTGKVRIQATDKDGERISAKDMLAAIAAQGGGIAPGNDDFKMTNDDNTLEVRLPSAQNIVKQMTYGDEIRQLLQMTENKISTNPRSIPSSGLVIDIGRSPKGQRYSIKVTKSMTANIPSYVLLADGNEFMPANKGANPKENLISTLNTLMDGAIEK